jgi:hypothetical protein
MATTHAANWLELGTLLGAVLGWVAASYAFLAQRFAWPVSDFWYFFVLRVMGFWWAVICLAIAGMAIGTGTAIVETGLSLVLGVGVACFVGGARFGFQ